MVALPPLLTQANATQRLAADGMASLGLAGVRFSSTWSAGDVGFNDSQLALSCIAAVRTPFTALRRFVDAGVATGAFDVAGDALLGPATVLELHPQAFVRLERLVTSRLGAAAGGVRPVPRMMVIHGAGGTTVDQWFPPGVDLVTGINFSFHDDRGLIVDPIAFAALVNDLATALPAFAAGTFPATGAGGVTNIAGSHSGVIVHVIDPHGRRFAAPTSEAPAVVDGGGNVVGSVPSNGLVELAAGQGIGLPAGATRVRVGFARNGVLGRVPVFPPALAGVTLGRQFLRVCAVDLPWHVLGNRTAAPVQGVGPDDQTMPAQFVPRVRDRVAVDLLADGVDVLAAAGQVLGALTPPPPATFTGLVFAASPVIDAGVGVPPTTGAAGHWPIFPAAAGPPGTVTGSPASGLTATWSGPHDVVLSFPAGTIPVGASVRVYPQVFQVIRSIGEEPSFLRGDGAATIVTGTGPFSVLLSNPLHLDDGVSQPADSLLVCDIVVTDRTPRRRTFGAVVVPIMTGTPAAAPADLFGAPDPMAIVPPTQLGIGPSPVFGIRRTGPAPSGGTPGSVVELIRRLTGETAPRNAPRLPTMARFPTVVAVGTGATTAPMAWDAVVSGGRWSRETRSALHHLGNPGNPAGPDVDAPGVRIDGALAFDAARIAMRRAQAMLPFGPGSLGWIPFVGNAGWVPPGEPATDAPAAPGRPPRTCAGAVLRTIAVGTETPELLPDVFPIPAADASVQNLVNDIASALNLPPPTVTVANEATIRDEIREEFFVTRFGRRDALWSLNRALRQAHEFVLIVSPQLARTARPPGDPQAHEIDLVEVLVDRMTGNPALRVVVALPLWPDIDAAYGGWVREAFAARNEALDELLGVDEGRVVAFHPLGFPGRVSALRSTIVIVDDVWAMVGTSHLRRRGMTFDEGVDVVAIDRDFDNRGASRRVRAFRRELLGSLLQVPPGDPLDSDAIRIASPAGAFDVVHDVLEQNGLGRIRPFWRGPTDMDVIAQSPDVADPDGSTSDNYLTMFAGLIGESPP